jgi:hypothetical protein
MILEKGNDEEATSVFQAGTGLGPDDKKSGCMTRREIR